MLKIFMRNPQTSLFYFFCLIGVSSIIWMLFAINSQPTQQKFSEATQLPQENSKIRNVGISDNIQKTTKRTVENKALLFVKQSRTVGSIVIAMVYARFKHKSVDYFKSRRSFGGYVGKDLIGLYSVVVFEDLSKYLKMEDDDKRLLMDYCKEYSVGIIFFAPPSTSLEYNKNFDSFPLHYSTGLPVKSYQVIESPIPNLTRKNVNHNTAFITDWTVFHPNHATYQPISIGIQSESGVDSPEFTTALLDNGQLDGIRRIFFGHSHNNWLHKTLFLDALSFLTQRAMSLPQKRYLQIDIDDMFLGANGTKMVASDAEVTISAYT